MKIQLHPDAIGGKTAFNFKVGVLTGDPETGQVDVAPDAGSWAFEAKKVLTVDTVDAKFVPLAPRAGFVFQAPVVRITLSDGTTILAPKYRCVAQLGGKLLRGKGQSPRGVWITPDDVNRMDEILSGAGGDVRLIVVTDNERILGLGDQGAGGIAIPVGKLALYTVAAGIYPSRTLPISLDVGTDRQDLLDDPLYLGYRARRLRGAAYDEMVEAFVESVRRVFPSAVVQWEDFKQHNAVRILGRYRHRLPSFNDDIQGTGAVVLAGLLTARRTQRGLVDDRFMLVGAGAAGIGIASMIERELATNGATSGRAGSDEPHLVLLDSVGLVHTGRDDIHDDQRPLAVDPAWFAAAGVTGDGLRDTLAIARAFRPTVLIGTTGQRGLFSRELIEIVAGSCPHPVILPLSNPTDRAEAEAGDLLSWTKGRAFVATGSPSPEVEWKGARRVIGQANNAFIFPGVGLGAMIAEVRAIPDEVFVVAAHELAKLVRRDRVALGALYPPVSDLRRAARSIAIATVKHLRDCGYGRQLHDEEVVRIVDAEMWRPEYTHLTPQWRNTLP